MTIDAKKLRLVQVARRKLALDDAQYRNLLYLADGVDSSKKLSMAGFSQFMEICAHLGFQSDFAARNMGHRAGMATPAQIALMKRIWGETRYGDSGERGLERWVEEHFTRSALRFIEDAEAPRVIGALLAVKSRAAAQQDGGGG
jgi:phage gp16-like protein